MSIWFYLTFVLALILFLISGWFDEKWGDSYSASASGTVLRFFTFAGLIFVLCLGVPRGAFKTVEYEYETRNIESLTLNSTINGEARFAFTIGYAYVNEHPYYYFYEDRVGGMYLNSVSAYHSVLIETDDCTPHIDVPKLRKFSNPSWLAKTFRTKERLQSLANGIPFFDGHQHANGTIDWNEIPVRDEYMIKIYVPTNTIKKQFDANTANL